MFLMAFKLAHFQAEEQTTNQTPEENMTDELKTSTGAIGADTHATSQLLDFLNANADNILTGGGSSGVESIVFPTDETPGITNPSGNFEDMVLIKATDKTIKASEQVKASDKDMNENSK